MADRRSSRVKNLTLAAIAAQAGCATLVIVILALMIGLWLDTQMGRRGPFTIGLLVLSVPLSLYIMVRIALGAVRRIVPSLPDEDASTESEEV